MPSNWDLGNFCAKAGFFTTTSICIVIESDLWIHPIIMTNPRRDTDISLLRTREARNEIAHRGAQLPRLHNTGDDERKTLFQREATVELICMQMLDSIHLHAETDSAHPFTQFFYGFSNGNERRGSR